MATVYKKSNSKNWYAQFFDSSGKRISRSTGTTRKREAERIAAGLEAKERELNQNQPGLAANYAKIVEAAAREAAAGELSLARADELIKRLHRIANPSFEVISLSDHLSNWIRQQESHVTDKTARTYWDMRRRMLAALGPRAASSPVGDLTKDQISNALKKITTTRIKGTERTITASTANMDLRALRRALRDAVEKGLARANSAESIRPLPETDSIERAPFSAEEVRKLIDSPHTPKEWKGAILVAAHTGLRLGDVVSLNRSHIDGARLNIRPEKTKKARTTISIPLSPQCLAWIEGKEGNFFPSLKDTKTGTLATTFVRIMAKAGVPREVRMAGNVMGRRSFHSLRHSFTSWLADADVHADVRQKLTGHSSAGVHSRYTHHDEALERAVTNLPDLWE